jgi:hypothetical protein
MYVKQLEFKLKDKPITITSKLDNRFTFIS